MWHKMVAFSGGKDSTALVLALAEVGLEFELVFTPTGNELPGVIDHIYSIAEMVDRTLMILGDHDLEWLIRKEECIPNWQKRFCTVSLKIEPTLDYLKTIKNPLMYVGFRADEDSRKGIYDDFTTYQYPFQHWGWGLDEVLNYLDIKEVRVPERTDCAWCFFQRLIDWQRLWKNHQSVYLQGEALEEEFGHTFRSPTKDKWPASMKELRVMFEKGWIPNYRKKRKAGCKICTM